MATVYNNIDNVAGDPLASVVVSITLLWDTSVSSIATQDAEERLIRSSYGTETDDDGYWEVNLIPNTEITPDDSVYKITEKLTSDSTTLTYYISVPDQATPTSWVGDILVEQPAWA
jgi:hypothetical protein